jgi:hypothetical protein
LISIDAQHDADQCRRDLENSLARLSDRGWIVVAHGANPPTERPRGGVEQALVRLLREHADLELWTLDVNQGCALLRRRVENGHRRASLNLIPASTKELRKLLC